MEGCVSEARLLHFSRQCYYGVMPRTHNTKIKVPTHNISAQLTEDEIAVLNATRAPSEKLRISKTCGARLNTAVDGPLCKKTSGAGTQHVGWGYCSNHGGGTEAGNKHAAHLMGLDIIERQKQRIDRFGGDRTDPSIAKVTAEQALLEEVRRSVAMVRWLEEMIGKWDYSTEADGIQDAVEQYVNGQDLKGLPRLITETAKGVASTTDKAEWLRIYREERSESAKVAKMCIDAGIAHRMVSIAEDQGRILATALRAALNLLNLSPQQAGVVPLVVPAILRAVASDQPLQDLVPQLATIPEVRELNEASPSSLALSNNDVA